MLSSILQLEFVCEGKTGRFLADNNTPIHVAKEMLFQFQSYIAELERKAIAEAEELAKNTKEEAGKVLPAVAVEESKVEAIVEAI